MFDLQMINEEIFHVEQNSLVDHKLMINDWNNFVFFFDLKSFSFLIPVDPREEEKERFSLPSNDGIWSNCSEKTFVLIVHRISPELCWTWSNSLKSISRPCPATISKWIFDYGDGRLNDRIKSKAKRIRIKPQPTENESKHFWAEFSKANRIKFGL